ncbi:MAG: transposase [Burkholderiaceae bacterium]|nr:transposase [Burkholderiaceae bacterium]
MARPLRIEFPGAVYHVTSRGHANAAIFMDDADRQSLLAVIEQGMARFDAQVLAYSLLGEHYQLLLYTAQGNLSRLMRHINGVYTQAFNRRHGKNGPVFQGRFKGVLVDRDQHLLAACQYVESAPKRAGLTRGDGYWPWSSHAAHTLQTDTPAWLETKGLLSYVLGREARTPGDQRKAAQKYQAALTVFDGDKFWDTTLRHQIYLGDEAFVARMQAMAGGGKGRAVAKNGKARNGKTGVAQWIKDSDSREQGLLRAYTEGGLSMTAMADGLGLSVSRVSRLIARAEAQRGSGPR